MLNLKAENTINPKADNTCKTTFFNLPLRLLLVIGTLCILIIPKPQVALADVESSTVTSGILEVPSSDDEVTLTFPLYKVDNVQYFSAGVGVEERNASYPAYPLKLIFVQGERAFLADVTVSIARPDGTSLADIPGEHVMGPWLFVEIPPGTYTVTATDSRQRMIKKEIQVGERGTSVVHFRWPAL